MALRHTYKAVEGGWRPAPRQPRRDILVVRRGRHLHYVASGKRRNGTGSLAHLGSGELVGDIFFAILPNKRPLPRIQSALPIDRP
jgi:hypothetical protein